MLSFVCIFTISLLIGACAGTNKMQKSANMNETAQIIAKADSKENKIDDEQEIVCRHKAITGSRFKRKICKTKAQWAREDHSKQQTAEKLQKDTDRSSSLSVPSGDAFGGMSVGVPR